MTRMRFRRFAGFLVAALLAWPVALHTGCEGGTTGVDNPGLTELTVEFRDQAGDMTLVQGTLEIYERDHNPAVSSEPLLRIEVLNHSGLRLTRADIDRIDSARAPKAAAANWKRAASAEEGVAMASGTAARGTAISAASPTASDSVIRFNLVFRNGSGSGAVATGLSYDRIGKVFRLERGGAFPGVRMLPKPMLRFAARIHRETVPGDLGRVFLPGTPFQATLVDSDFALQHLPEGRFGMRLLGDGGYVYAVRETLDTRASTSFTAAPEPIERVEAAIAPVGFGVDAGGPLYANQLETTGLSGKLLSADPNDSRLSFRWRLLRPVSPDSAPIDDPTLLTTKIMFPSSGTYSVELSATLGATTVRDTVQYKVAPVVSPAPAKFLSPAAGDSLKQGQTYKINWDSPISGRARLEYNYKDGAEGGWVPAVDSVAIAPGAGGTTWTTPVTGTVSPCLLRLRMIPGDSLLAQIPAPFFLVP